MADNIGRHDTGTRWDHVLVVNGMCFYVDKRVTDEVERLRMALNNAEFDLRLAAGTINNLKSAIRQTVMKLAPTVSDEEIERTLNVLTGDNE